MMNTTLPKLIECLQNHYNLSDLEKLCTIFDIPSGNVIIQNETISQTVLRLIGYFKREYGNVDSLVEAVIQTRPNLPCVVELKNLYEGQPDSKNRLSSNRMPTEMKVGVILVSDIEESTNKLKNKNQSEWLNLIEKHNVIVRERIAKHNGVELRTQGDGFVIAFYTSKDSVLFSLDVQLAFVLWNAECILKHDQIRVRIGLHFNEIRLKDGYPEGKTALIASRISALAKGGEIIVSDTIYSAVQHDLNINFQDFGIRSLKGLEIESYQLYKIDWKKCLKDSVEHG